MTRKNYFLIGIVIVVAIASGIAVQQLYFTMPSFPPIAAGRYVGEISAVSGKRHDYFSFYAERKPDSNILIVAPILQDWEPQQVELKIKDDLINTVRFAEEVPFEAVVIRTKDHTFSLYGRSRDGKYVGKVLREDGLRGIWKLMPIADEVVERGSVQASIYDVNFADWLKIKADNLSATEATAAQQNTIQEQARAIANMESHINDEAQLKKRAKEQLESTQKSLQEETKRKDVLEKEVAGLADQLELLGRITKRGQVVTLARRTAGREAKWYQAYWQSKDETAAAQEALGGEFSLDMNKFQDASRQAQEVTALKQEIAKERERIAELRERLSQAQAPAQPEAEEQGQDYRPPARVKKPKKEEPGFFEKVFGF